MNLSLVDDAEVVQAIETSRLVQHVMPLLENPVSELDALVSSAMGLETVQADRNPVRPEVFAQTLRELFGKAPVKAASGSLWMKYLAEPLGAELQQLYGGLVAQLKGANVQAAGYGRTPGARPARLRPGGATTTSRRPRRRRTTASRRQPTAACRAGRSAAPCCAIFSRPIRRRLRKPRSRAYYAGVEQELAAAAAPGRAQRRRRSGPGRAARLSELAAGRPAGAAGRRPQHAEREGLGRLRGLARAVHAAQPAAPGRDPDVAGAGPGTGARSGRPGGARPALAGAGARGHRGARAFAACGWRWSIRASSATSAIPAGC